MDTPVRVIHLGRSGDVAGGMTQFILDCISWQVPGFSQELLPSRSRTRGRTLLAFLSALVTIAKLDRSKRAVVVVHLSQGGSFIREGTVGGLAHRRGFAVVAHIHGSSFSRFAAKHRTLVTRTLKGSDVVVVLTEESRNVVAQCCPDTPVVLIPNAVNPGAVAPKEKIVVFGGSVSRRKGVDTLLAAWAELNHHGWRLLIAGPATDSTLTSDLPRSVELLGSLPREQFRSLLARASIAVLPSRAEGLPLFVLEALSSRAAVVGTDVGGMSSVIDRANGVLVPVDDVPALAEALQRLIDEPALRDELSTKGAASFEANYSPSAIVPQLASAWTTALARHISGS